MGECVRHKEARVVLSGLTPDKSGGLNGSTQHSSRTRLALKTKAKSLARLDQQEHYPG
jgi:hypothetical protein